MTIELHFRLDLPPDEALRYYQGKARVVVVIADNGQQIQFPAEHIRPFIEQSGVQGYFSIQFDDDNKLLDLRRINS
ncbi:MAG: DUF2835 domain-containing protein [Gammaproteobacteria bacterium]|nr:MAG: DUF2835 domain-containing protein [Gammaproteobacteria bacterium]RLA01710.1 MAG: DUF2835 domain-containing protein [Gammaproteobacteria bacterium]